MRDGWQSRADSEDSPGGHVGGACRSGHRRTGMGPHLRGEFNGDGEKTIGGMERRESAEITVGVEQTAGFGVRGEMRNERRLGTDHTRARMGQQRGNDLLVFLRLERAGGIYEAATGSELGQTAERQGFLFFGQRG